LGGVVGDAGLNHGNTLAAPACPLKPPTPPLCQATAW
jgi:hypothetical protein